jgi:hypothetical protein
MGSIAIAALLEAIYVISYTTKSFEDGAEI